MKPPDTTPAALTALGKIMDEACAALGLPNATFHAVIVDAAGRIHALSNVERNTGINAAIAELGRAIAGNPRKRREA